MFDKWFKSSERQPQFTASQNASPALNAVEMVLAIDMLQNAHTPSPLSHNDAVLVAQHLQSRRYIFDEVLMRAGDKDSSNYMLWILEGQAVIEAVSTNPHNPVTMTVLEPGSTVGEMGLLDGEARSATCTAASPMRCAMLTRPSLLSLSAKYPEVAVKVMLIISLSMAVRLRDVTEKFRRYVLMANAIHDELMASPPMPLSFSDAKKDAPASVSVSAYASGREQ